MDNIPWGAEYDLNAPWNDDVISCNCCSKICYGIYRDEEYCQDCGSYFEDEDYYIFKN